MLSSLSPCPPAALGRSLPLCVCAVGLRRAVHPSPSLKSRFEARGGRLLLANLTSHSSFSLSCSFSAPPCIPGSLIRTCCVRVRRNVYMCVCVRGSLSLSLFLSLSLPSAVEMARVPRVPPLPPSFSLFLSPRARSRQTRHWSTAAALHAQRKNSTTDSSLGRPPSCSTLLPRRPPFFQPPSNLAWAHALSSPVPSCNTEPPEAKRHVFINDRARNKERAKEVKSSLVRCAVQCGGRSRAQPSARPSARPPLPLVARSSDNRSTPTPQNNRIRTSKYSLLTFIPVNLLEQCVSSLASSQPWSDPLVQPAPHAPAPLPFL